MAGGVIACLREGYGCTRNGESVRLSLPGLSAVAWPFELPDVSGSIGTGSGVNRSRSRTAERLDFAATIQRDELQVNGCRRDCSHVYPIRIVP
jgi:hypothetical protein